MGEALQRTPAGGLGGVQGEEGELGPARRCPDGPEQWPGAV